MVRMRDFVELFLHWSIVVPMRRALFGRGGGGGMLHWGIILCMGDFVELFWGRGVLHWGIIVCMGDFVELFFWRGGCCIGVGDFVGEGDVALGYYTVYG